MSVREPWKIRKVMLAGAVALALTGTGVAIAWSASDPSPSPSPSASAPPSESAPGKKDKTQRSPFLHSESVVKKADGTFETELSQQGTVDAVSATSVTVKSEDGFTQSYAVNAETGIIKFPAPKADGTPATGDDGKRLGPSKATIAEIAAGQSIRVAGVKNGNGATARNIVEGAGPGKAMGNGLGKGLGKGMGKGHGHGLGKGDDAGTDS